MLRNPGLAMSKKVNILQTYVLSKGLFQAGTWPTLKPNLYKRFHSCILSMYRDVCGHKFHNKDDDISPAEIFNDDDVIYKYGFVCPRTMLRLAKLTLFCRVVLKFPPSIIGLLLCYRWGPFESY